MSSKRVLVESDQLWASLDLSVPPENISGWWKLLETWRNVGAHSRGSQAGGQPPQGGAVRPSTMDNPSYFLPVLVNSALVKPPKKSPIVASTSLTQHAPSTAAMAPILTISHALAPADVAPRMNTSAIIPAGVTLRMPPPAPQINYSSLVRPLAAVPRTPRGVAYLVRLPVAAMTLPVHTAIWPPAAPPAVATPDWKRDLFWGNHPIPADRMPAYSLVQGAGSKDNAGPAQPSPPSPVPLVQPLVVPQVVKSPARPIMLNLSHNQNGITVRQINCTSADLVEVSLEHTGIDVWLPFKLFMNQEFIQDMMSQDPYL